MSKKKVQGILAILLVIFAIGTVFLNNKLADIDQAIIWYGVATVRNYQTLSRLLIGLAIGSLLGIIALQFVSKAKVAQELKQETQAKKSNPSYGEQEIQSKLLHLAQEHTAYETDLQEAQRMISQINDCIEDLQQLQVDNDYEMLDKINYSMTQAKTQILQNSKSIINRVTVEGDPQEIAKRLQNSAEIVSQVRGLLNETVNYLDSKSPSTKADLESMTSALKTLNHTIN